MKEKNIEDKIKHLLKEHNIYYVKIHGGMYQTPGVPDLIINYQGFFLALEVKKHPNKPTEIQRYHLLKIRKTLGISLIINEFNFEQLKSLIQKGASYEDFVSFSNQCFEVFGI